MTQEEKQLLLKDLCARLPYEVKINIESEFLEEKGWSIQRLLGIDLSLQIVIAEHNSYKIEKCKPYLRPLTSMTDEEKKEYHIIDDRAYTCPEQYAHIPASDRIDWLNKKMFDYHGLIPMGIALEAPEGMYK